MLLIPAVIPSTLVFVLWKWMYNYQVGPINHFLVDVLGLFTVQNAPQWLGGTALTLPSIAIMEVWWGLGYHTIFFLAGLAAIPKDLPEAARIDGANEWQIFWHVTRPRPAPIMMILVVLRFGTAMAVIDEYLIFGGFNRDSPTYTWTIFMYDQAFKLGPVAAGLRGGDRHDRRGGHDDRHGRPAPHLPSEGLTWHGARRRLIDGIDPIPPLSEPASRLVQAEPRRDRPSCGDQLLHGDHPAAARLGAADVGQVAARRDAGRFLADDNSTSPTTATSSRRSTRCRSICSTASTSPPARC